uniref:SMP-30/gluconolactonase/LRE family protein n=1 Tax=Cohnella sp. GbtcB17 TaxID=2824762 RepID=UPI001C2F77BC
YLTFPDSGMDGIRCDMAGNLYVTRIGTGCIAQINPRGEVVREIPQHGKNCTNLTFGGADGRTCYVTMVDGGNIEKFRSEFPGRRWGLLR